MNSIFHNNLSNKSESSEDSQAKKLKLEKMHEEEEKAKRTFSLSFLLNKLVFRPDAQYYSIWNVFLSMMSIT